MEQNLDKVGHFSFVVFFSTVINLMTKDVEKKTSKQPLRQNFELQIRIESIFIYIRQTCGTKCANLNHCLANGQIKYLINIEI